MSRIASRSLTLVLTLCLAGLLSACSTIDRPKGKNDGYASARFVQAKGDAMEGAENAVELNRVIQEAVEAEFLRQGIRMGDADAELIVAYMLITQDNVSTTRIDDYYGYGSDASKIAERAHSEGVLKNKRRDQFQRGAIVIDLVDAGSGKLLYRDYAVREILQGVTGDQQRARIQEAVQEALAGFFR